jgi:hypothetical protein
MFQAVQAGGTLMIWKIKNIPIGYMIDVPNQKIKSKSNQIKSHG